MSTSENISDEKIQGSGENIEFQFWMEAKADFWLSGDLGLLFIKLSEALGSLHIELKVKQVELSGNVCKASFYYRTSHEKHSLVNEVLESVIIKKDAEKKTIAFENIEDTEVSELTQDERLILSILAIKAMTPYDFTPYGISKNVAEAVLFKLKQDSLVYEYSLSGWPSYYYTNDTLFGKEYKPKFMHPDIQELPFAFRHDHEGVNTKHRKLITGDVSEIVQMGIDKVSWYMSSRYDLPQLSQPEVVRAYLAGRFLGIAEANYYSYDPDAFGSLSTTYIGKLNKVPWYKFRLRARLRAFADFAESLYKRKEPSYT